MKLIDSIDKKVADFPFDTQCCEINFYSWAHTASQLELLQFQNKNVTNLTHFSHNTEWNIYKTCASNTTIKTNQDLGIFAFFFILLFFKFHKQNFKNGG